MMLFMASVKASRGSLPLFSLIISNAPYTTFCATPFLPSSMMLLMSLVTSTLLYTGSGKISLLGTLPLLGTILPSFIKK